MCGDEKIKTLMRRSEADNNFFVNSSEWLVRKQQPESLRSIKPVFSIFNFILRKTLDDEEYTTMIAT